MNRHLVPLALSVLCFGGQALADWDPALEARKQAQRDAARRAEQKREQEAQQLRSEAQAKANQAAMASKRKALGAAANGNSDAEVNRLYEAKMKRDTESANRSAQAAREALSSGQGAAAVKQATGKSMKEIESMSDDELDALARQMEKKYGK